ncbi:MAG: TrmH family RNA methyltransferase [Bacteroidetes bacterium]|nr:TrmH family RNA methyltransferase [Bacteroidota bacterium]
MNTNSVDFFNNNSILSFSKNKELILAVWEIGNPENIGQIIRLAHNVGASKVLFVNEKVNFRESKIKKTAGFSYEQMSWEFITPNDFFILHTNEFKLVVLETCEGSTNIFAGTLPDKTILLAGSESYGLPPSIIEKSDFQVHIPMPGGCKSMNISHALSVAAFEWYRQKAI